MKGAAFPYWCTSATSCEYRYNESAGAYNLDYVYFDTTGVTQEVVDHEFGHVFGLVHSSDCFGHPSVMIAGCLSYPSLNDGQFVDWI